MLVGITRARFVGYIRITIGHLIQTVLSLSGKAHHVGMITRRTRKLCSLFRIVWLVRGVKIEMCYRVMSDV